ncbi:MAG: NADP oxidoreductase, partial [Candidatus Omnitrophica bacterium]|nr:NADP oxidoreductase [Candidatus Omnitrophota bacterium]
PIPGLYCAGWIKRGPSGMIGTNKMDSSETVESFFADLPQLPRVASSTSFQEFLKNKKVQFITFQDWKQIDMNEIERGKKCGKPREKFLTVDEMLQALPVLK